MPAAAGLLALLYRALYAVYFDSSSAIRLLAASKSACSMSIISCCIATTLSCSAVKSFIMSLMSRCAMLRVSCMYVLRSVTRPCSVPPQPFPRHLATLSHAVAQKKLRTERRGWCIENDRSILQAVIGKSWLSRPYLFCCASVQIRKIYQILDSSGLAAIFHVC